MPSFGEGLLGAGGPDWTLRTEEPEPEQVASALSPAGGLQRTWGRGCRANWGTPGPINHQGVCGAGTGLRRLGRTVSTEPGQPGEGAGCPRAP